VSSLVFSTSSTRRRILRRRQQIPEWNWRVGFSGFFQGAGHKCRVDSSLKLVAGGDGRQGVACGVFSEGGKEYAEPAPDSMVVYFGGANWQK